MGHRRILFKSDQEPSIQELKNAVVRELDKSLEAWLVMTSSRRTPSELSRGRKMCKPILSFGEGCLYRPLVALARKLDARWEKGTYLTTLEQTDAGCRRKHLTSERRMRTSRPRQRKLFQDAEQLSEELGHAKMKLHDYFKINPTTGQWDEAGLTADLEILRKRKARAAGTEVAGDQIDRKCGPEQSGRRCGVKHEHRKCGSSHTKCKCGSSHTIRKCGSERSDRKCGAHRRRNTTKKSADRQHRAPKGEAAVRNVLATREMIARELSESQAQKSTMVRRPQVRPELWIRTLW
eukprot:4560138-Amphidinium_carterae.2